MKTKTQHTPGPWKVSRHGTPDYAPQFGIYEGDSMNDLAIVRGKDAEANAALIAAAPQLLAACKEMLAWYGPAVLHGGRNDIAGELSRAHSAIAAAEGN